MEVSLEGYSEIFKKIKRIQSSLQVKKENCKDNYLN